jgi:hypothetical protein
VRKEIHDIVVDLLQVQMSDARKFLSSPFAVVSGDMVYNMRGAHAVHGTQTMVEAVSGCVVAALHFSARATEHFGLTVAYNGSAKSAEAAMAAITLGILKAAGFQYSYLVTDGDCALHKLAMNGTYGAGWQGIEGATANNSNNRMPSLFPVFHHCMQLANN